MFYLLNIYKLLLQNNLNQASSEGNLTDIQNTIGIFASGSKNGGGSGAKILIEKILDGEITGVSKVVLLSNHVKGGVSEILKDEKIAKQVEESDIEFEFVEVDDFPKRVVDKTRKSGLTEESEENITAYCNDLIETYKFDYTFLSGWLKMLLEIKAVNIHPGPLASQGYGGDGKHGAVVHNQVWEDYRSGEINQSCVSMHWITPEYDSDKHSIVQIPVSLITCTSADEVGTVVNNVEKEFQWIITKLIIDGDISWTGNKDDKVIINQEAVDKYNFPKGTVFGPIKKGFLQEGRAYDHTV